MEFRTYIDQYQEGIVQITPQVSYSLRKVIENNVRLMNGQFEEPYYDDGTRKLFYNIGYIMASTIYKNTDLDTKDIGIRSLTPTSMELIGLYRAAVKANMKNLGYDQFMNDSRWELINQGHVISKEVKGESKLLNLQNIIRPAYSEDIQKDGIMECTLLTWDDMLQHKEDWADNWDMIEELYGRMQSDGIFYFKVYEWWKMDKFMVNGKEQLTKGCVKYIDSTLLTNTLKNEQPSTWQADYELERFATVTTRPIYDKIKKKNLKKQGYLINDEEPIFPYEEQHFIKIRGRWMGMGVYELMAGVQEQYNEIMNTKRRYDELNHKGIIVHKQPSFGEQRTLTQEFIENLSTGAVIDVSGDEDLQRLDMGNLTIDFLTSADKVFEFARQLTGITAQGTGETLPSSTPATIGVINQQNSKTTFDVLIEQQGIYFKNVFENFKLKQIIEHMDAQEWTSIMGSPEDLNELEELFIENLAYERISAAVMRGEYVKDEEVDMLVEAIRMERQKQGGNRFAEIKKQMVKNIPVSVEFYITNESFDKNIKVQNMLQMLNNPLYTGSRTRLEEEILDLLELSGRRYKKTDDERQNEMEMLQANNAAAGKMGGSQPQIRPALSTAQQMGNNV
ncbi:MAG: hypothetical protein WC666_03845 [Candidatus Paceibacterota bacterium]|jgi:hypothetical protein